MQDMRRCLSLMNVEEHVFGLYRDDLAGLSMTEVF